MCKKFLLLSVLSCSVILMQAQSKKQTTAFAITAAEKGQNNWKEIRLVDLQTGEAIQSIFKSAEGTEILNARTGKPVQKRDAVVIAGQELKNKVQVYAIDASGKTKVISNGEEASKYRTAGNKIVIVRTNSSFNQKPQYDNPFATNSAALAYDKKHERLYYTPMGINQLRYIDLKSKTPKVYYFEDEAFGTVKGQWDAPNQITRMVIASDGNGYALTNDANHLIRFTTGKKPEITDLGAVIENAAAEHMSIHRGMGGDMIADNDGNLYLITAYRNIFKINIETKAAEYQGRIKGLPENFQTNGAVVEEGNKIIVCSGSSTEGYYRFDLTTLQAERVSAASTVFNASDLANGNLAVTKEKKEEPKKEVVVESVAKQPVITEIAKANSIVVYPNPVTDGLVKLSFNNQPAGKYNVQVLDMSGKVVTTQNITINGKSQVQELRLPSLLAKGNYLVKIINEDSNTNTVTKLAVQ